MTGSANGGRWAAFGLVRLLIRASGLLVVIPLVTARGQAVVSGRIADSLGRPIAGVSVSIPAVARSAETDSNGVYRLREVAPGTRVITARRLGFVPYSRVVNLKEGENAVAEIVLSPIVTSLGPVVSEANALWKEAPLLREMADHMKIGLGQFVLRKDLEKLTALRTDRAFQQRLGLLVVTDASGHAYIASSRRRSIQQECYALIDARGATSPNNAGCLYCFPTVYLDGVPLSIRINEVPDVNQFAPERLEAIEIYASAAQTPARYSGLNSHCGVILFHSRRPPLPY